MNDPQHPEFSQPGLTPPGEAAAAPPEAAPVLPLSGESPDAGAVGAAVRVVDDVHPWRAEYEASLARRRGAVLGRMRTLLFAGLAAFVTVVWVLVSVPDATSYLPFGPGPATTVRRHLDALNRGELRVAYELFSPQYRARVDFRLFHALVVEHGEMFRTRQVAFDPQETSASRAVLHTHITSEDGEHYLARFTLVRRDGRWWIDDLRWSLDDDGEEVIRA